MYHNLVPHHNRSKKLQSIDKRNFSGKKVYLKFCNKVLEDILVKLFNILIDYYYKICAAARVHI